MLQFIRVVQTNVGFQCPPQCEERLHTTLLMLFLTVNQTDTQNGQSLGEMVKVMVKQILILAAF